jgi:hypothetical protein
MTELNQSIAHIPIPYHMRNRPISATGFPVPWFVANVDGAPDFRVVDTPKIGRGFHGDLCWLCGDKMGKFKCFVIGPMCAINRTSAELPCHRDCAVYAARACPFLTKPRMRRNTADMPEHQSPGGIMLERNPGVVLLWITLSYRPFKVDGGSLFAIGDPVRVEFYSQGRHATRAEIIESIDSGMPHLRGLAALEGRAALADLDARYHKAMKLLPKYAGQVDSTQGPRHDTSNRH